MLVDAASKGELEKRFICRTFSGCYPLEPFYIATPEAAALKEIKKRFGA